METEVARARAALGQCSSDFERHRLLMALKETNRAAFYALLQGPDLEALLRIVYTPTIGEEAVAGCMENLMGASRRTTRRDNQQLVACC